MYRGKNSELLVFGTSSQNKIIRWFVCCRDDEIQSADRWTQACTPQKSIKYSICNDSNKDYFHLKPWFDSETNPNRNIGKNISIIIITVFPDL